MKISSILYLMTQAQGVYIVVNMTNDVNVTFKLTKGDVKEELTKLFKSKGDIELTDVSINGSGCLVFGKESVLSLVA